MFNNSSMLGGEFSIQRMYRFLLVHVLIVTFLCVNFLLTTTFFMNEFFHTKMRYILFANALLSDCLILIVSGVLLTFHHFHSTMQIWLCLFFCMLASVLSLVTPITLTAMTLERYVAICIPLQHVELCSTHRALPCILIITGLSSIPCIVDISIYLFSSAYRNSQKQFSICRVDVFIIHSWHRHLKSAIYQFYFLIMCINIVFSYVKIWKVAKAASGENKKSTWKGLRTVILHGFQLLLCLIQLWFPFVEAAVVHIDFMLHANVRYFNYVTFYLTPRCLSPLIYGLRDDKFFLALKYYARCGNYKKKSLDLTN